MADGNAEKFEPGSKFCRENYYSFEIVADLEQILDILYPSKKILEKHQEKPWTFIIRNGFDHTSGLLTATLRFRLEDDDRSISTPLVDGEVHKRLKPSILVTFVDGRLQCAALFQL